MSTLEQLKNAHAKVKNGADFPNYIREIKILDITAYETFVADGHTDFYSSEGYSCSFAAKYDPLQVRKNAAPEKFSIHLKDHQAGHTDYLTFCTQAADSGIHKWIVDLSKLTCSYLDQQGEIILVETIPIS